MKTFQSMLTLICGLVLLTIFSTSCFSQRSARTANTEEVCETQRVLNLMLIDKYNDEIYRLTGIMAQVSDNNIIIMAEYSLQLESGQIAIDELFKNVYLALVQEEIEYGGIGYIIVSNQQSTIATTGEGLQKYMYDFETLNRNAIKLHGTYNYSGDRNFRRIMRNAVINLKYIRHYGRDRITNYKNAEKGC